MEPVALFQDAGHWYGCGTGAESVLRLTVIIVLARKAHPYVQALSRKVSQAPPPLYLQPQ